MNANTQTQRQSLSPVATFFVASGGGVVGYDYATWMKVDALTGTIIGLIVSAVMVQFLNTVYRDSERKIREGCVGMGALLGAAFGFYSVASHSTDGVEQLFGAALFGVMGAGLGSMAASLLSYAAFLLLFLSQGPVGFAIRSMILGAN